MQTPIRRTLLLAAMASMPLFAHAQSPAPAAAAPAPPAYGMSLDLETAKKVTAAAVAEARKSSLFMAIAIMDTGGNLVYFEKMDNTQTGSVAVAMDKGRSAVLFRRPTKVFQDTLAQGGQGLRFLGLTGAVPVDGGVPLLQGGKIVGAIGVSGGTSDQDGQVAQAGVAALK
jgi:glc operon protein GlcG